jgi:signal transduction histidine kinase
LGLSIVKSIIDLHNGQINVKTINNEKIIFTIII